MGLREQQREARRRRMVAAALDAFEQLGYDGATVEDIAARAGVSVPTLFRYFPSKVDLLFADHEDILSAWERSVREACPGESLLDALVRATLGGALRAGDGRLARVGARLIPTHVDLQRRQLEFDQRAAARAATAIRARLGLDDDDLRPSIVVAAVMAAVRAAREVWRLGPQEEDLAVAIERAMRGVPDAMSLLG